MYTFLPNSCNGQDQRRIHKKWQKFGQSMKIADFADRWICSAWQWIKFLFGNVNMCNREVGVLSSAQKSWLIIMDATLVVLIERGLQYFKVWRGWIFFPSFMDLGIGMWQMLYTWPDDIFPCGEFRMVYWVKIIFLTLESNLKQLNKGKDENLNYLHIMDVILHQ
jgi:hypothetical protein